MMIVHIFLLVELCIISSSACPHLFACRVRRLSEASPYSSMKTGISHEALQREIWNVLLLVTLVIEQR